MKQKVYSLLNKIELLYDLADKNNVEHLKELSEYDIIRYMTDVIENNNTGAKPKLRLLK